MPTDLFISKKGSSDHPPVVCLHGLLGASRNLFRLTSKIAEAGFYVISFDQRGHGHSPHLKKGEAYSFQSFATDLKEVLDTLGLSEVQLVGHSLGARVSLSFAGLFPHHVKSLCMLDAGVTIDPLALKSLRETIDPLPLEFLDKSDADRFLSRYEPGLKQFLFSNLRAENQKMKWIVDLEGLRHSLLSSIQSDQSEVWKNLQIPILIARGQLSDHFTQKELDRMLALNNNSKAVLISGAGHWLHVDNFDETSHAVLQFLQLNKE